MELTQLTSHAMMWALFVLLPPEERYAENNEDNKDQPKDGGGHNDDNSLGVEVRANQLVRAHFGQEVHLVRCEVLVGGHRGRSGPGLDLEVWATGLVQKEASLIHILKYGKTVVLQQTSNQIITL